MQSRAKLVLSFLQALCASGTRCVWAHTSDSGSAEALYMAKTMVLNLPDPSGPAESALDTLAETRVRTRQPFARRS